MQGGVHVLKFVLLKYVYIDMMREKHAEGPKDPKGPQKTPKEWKCLEDGEFSLSNAANGTMKIRGG